MTGYFVHVFKRKFKFFVKFVKKMSIIEVFTISENKKSKIGKKTLQPYITRIAVAGFNR